MNWNVRWKASNPEMDASGAWDAGCIGVAEFPSQGPKVEMMAVFAAPQAADEFANLVRGEVCVAEEWAGAAPSVVQSGEVSIPIEAGTSFGDGGHASTQLVLAHLRNVDLDGAAVLDVGCGSGVLAIAAAYQGARVRAVDVSEEAVAATTHNASVNGVDVKVDDTPVADLAQRFDHVLANLLLADQRPIAVSLAQLVRPGGRLVLSGLLQSQLSDALELYSDLKVVDWYLDGIWVCVVLANQSA